MSGNYEYIENDFLYCFECYKRFTFAHDVRDFEEYTELVPPNAIVWLQETRDCISGYCAIHQKQENEHPRFKSNLPYVWHDVADKETWKLATFNGEIGYRGDKHAQ